MWNIRIRKNAAKNLQKLPNSIQERFKALALELKVRGPVQPEWPNFGKIQGLSTVIIAISKRADQPMLWSGK